jgi:HlyD family secretion protein
VKLPVRLIAALVVATVAAGLLWLAWRPRSEDADRLLGYVEGEALYIAAASSGPVASVAVVRGQRVAAGAPLFSLDPRQVGAQSEQRRADIAEAEAEVRAAEARQGEALASAESARVLALDAGRQAQRYTAMRRADAGTVAAQDVERAQANARSTAALARAAAEQARTAAAQVAEARSRIAGSRAGLTGVAVQAEQLAPTSPTAARVEDVFFQPGEWAPANQPVVSLLPDERVKIRFFAPEATVALYRPGREIRFSCDGCGAPRSATIAYVSPRPEFTPPVIYSRDTRGRLVFMVEARPREPARLTPGLPVEVVPLASEPAR